MQKAVLVVLAVAAVCAVGGVAAFTLMQSESYAIEYELDGGEFVSDHPESYRPGKDIDVPSPVKDGYLSAGFYTDLETLTPLPAMRGGAPNPFPPPRNL